MTLKLITTDGCRHSQGLAESCFVAGTLIGAGDTRSVSTSRTRSSKQKSMPPSRNSKMRPARLDFSKRSLQQVLAWLRERSPVMASYFEKFYARRPREWASCFRVGTRINTNMFAESFHRTLKEVYFERKAKSTRRPSPFQASKDFQGQGL